MTSPIGSKIYHLSSSLFTISIQISFFFFLLICHPQRVAKFFTYSIFSPFPEPAPCSPELDGLSSFLSFHPDSGEQPGKTL